MKRIARVCLGAVLMGTLGCGGTSPAPQVSASNPKTTDVLPAADEVVWIDQTALSGVDHTYRNGEDREVNSILESIGGGVALFDYDRDGGLDLMAAGGGTFEGNQALLPFPTSLYRQQSPWQFADVADVSRIAKAVYYSHGLAVADFDADGFADVALTGYGGIMLWRNQGDGTFIQASAELGLDDDSWSTSAGWADLDNNGFPDLYLAHYVDWSFDNHPVCLGTDDVADVCPPRSFSGLDDAVFMNNGRGFSEAGQIIGLVPGGKGLGVVCGDLDLDGDTDIYVGNDTTENYLYLNNGAGRLQECGLRQGVAVDDRAHSDGSMGVDIGDYDDDGWPDLWVANYEAEAFGLYRNMGPAGFLYATPETGISAIGDLFVGFGTVFTDVDRDGDEDLLVSNGHVVQTARQSPIRQRPLWLENQAGKFTPRLPATGYFSEPHLGRGLCVGDIDNDGDDDLVFSHNNEPTVLLENRSHRSAGQLTVRLIGADGNRNAIGATVTLVTDQRRRLRPIIGGGSYLCHSDLAVTFWIPRDEVMQSLEILWPGMSSPVQYPLERGADRSILVSPESLWELPSRSVPHVHR